MRSFFQKSEKKEKVSFKEKSELVENNDDNLLLNEVQPYLASKTIKSRRIAYDLVYMIARRTTKAEVKTKAVELMTTGHTFMLENSVTLKRLKSFESTYFNQKARENILKGITKKYSQQEINFFVEICLEKYQSNKSFYIEKYDKLKLSKRQLRHKLDSIKNQYSQDRIEQINTSLPDKTILLLAGYLNISDAIYPVLDLINNPDIKDKSYLWTCRLALARMGIEEQVNYILDMVKKYPVNDDIAEVILPDLVYMRQQAAFNYLVEIIQSNSMSCTTTNTYNNDKIPCAYRVLEQITPVIKDFPLQIGPGGDIDTDDYHEALQTARQWLNDNPGYTLIHSVY